MLSKSQQKRVTVQSVNKPINEDHKRIIESAGAEYVAGQLGTLVLFNSRETGTTLAIEQTELTIERVRAHVAESNAKFKVKP